MSQDSKAPTVLYKYRPFNADTLSCLTRNVLWFASPKTFNDPFDGFVAAPKKREYEELKTVLGHHTSISNPFGDREFGFNLLDKIKNEGTASAITTFRSSEAVTEEELEQKIKSRGVFSGSTTATNQLMWSHYSQNHQGLCIGYEIDYSKMDYAHVRKINYPLTDDREVLMDTDLYNEELAIEKLLTCKSRHWEYEEEWRLILKEELATNIKGQEMPLIGEVHEIIFGMRMPDSHRETIHKIAKSKTFKKAIPKYRKFELDIKLYKA